VAADADAVRAFATNDLTDREYAHFFPLGLERIDEWFTNDSLKVLVSDRVEGQGIAGLMLIAVPSSAGVTPVYHTVVLVARDLRRHGLATALDEAMLADKNRTGRWMAMIEKDNEAGSRFLEARGFRHQDTHHHMRREPEAFPAEEVEGFTIEIYEGGDDDINAQVAEQNRRLYARDAVQYFTTPEEVARVFEVPGRFFILAREADTGDVAGFVDMTKEAFVCNLGVARKHWGTGLALELSRRTVAKGVDLGSDKISSFVRATNAASIRMQKRVGMEIVGTVYAYERDLGDG